MYMYYNKKPYIILYCLPTYSRRQKKGKRKHVSILFNRKNGNGMGGGAATKLMVRSSKQTITSSNYMPEESKKAERSTISVDLLVVEAI